MAKLTRYLPENIGHAYGQIVPTPNKLSDVYSIHTSYRKVTLHKNFE